MWAKSKSSGFTIVELLIVIVVIAVLASISIVAYNGIQQRARSSVYVTALHNWENLLQMQASTNGGWYNTGGYLVCLGTNYVAADGFAAGQCIRSVPTNVISASESSGLNSSVATAMGASTAPNGTLPVVKTVDPANSNREGYVRGLAYLYNSASTSPPFIEYYLDKGTGLNTCIGSDSVEYNAYADGAKRCRRYLQ